jgi:hypothetical protein
MKNQTQTRGNDFEYAHASRSDDIFSFRRMVLTAKTQPEITAASDSANSTWRQLDVTNFCDTDHGIGIDV